MARKCRSEDRRDTAIAQNRLMQVCGLFYLDHKTNSVNVLLPCHEYQNIALWIPQVDLYRLLHSGLDIILHGALGVQHVYRESTSRNVENGAPAKEIGK